MDDRKVKLLSSLHSLLYRSTNGLVGRRLVRNDMLLLTTTGIASGQKHTVPLLYLRCEARIIVIASYGGRQAHPQWYRNLVAQPKVSVQIEGTRFNAHATTMTVDERSTWWPEVVDAYDDYAVYQSRTDRKIPLVWLT